MVFVMYNHISCITFVELKLLWFNFYTKTLLVLIYIYTSKLPRCRLTVPFKKTNDILLYVWDTKGNKYNQK